MASTAMRMSPWPVMRMTGNLAVQCLHAFEQFKAIIVIRKAHVAQDGGRAGMGHLLHGRFHTGGFLDPDVSQLQGLPGAQHHDGVVFNQQYVHGGGGGSALGSGARGRLSVKQAPGCALSRTDAAPSHGRWRARAKAPVPALAAGLGL